MSAQLRGILQFAVVISAFVCPRQSKFGVKLLGDLIWSLSYSIGILGNVVFELALASRVCERRSGAVGGGVV